MGAADMAFSWKGLDAGVLCRQSVWYRSGGGRPYPVMPGNSCHARHGGRHATKWRSLAQPALPRKAHAGLGGYRPVAGNRCNSTRLRRRCV